jgi:hypothetical protein
MAAGHISKPKASGKTKIDYYPVCDNNDFMVLSQKRKQ